MARWHFLVGTVLVVSGCPADAPPPGEDDPPRAETAAPGPPGSGILDPDLPPAVAGEEGWDYQRSAEADLTGDGRAERVVLTARVEMHQGRPAWDDGQPWQVYVEAEDGTRTHVYAQRLQIGTLTMRLGRNEPGAPATIVLIEHLPDRLRVMEFRYGAPRRVTVETRFERDLDPRGDLASPQLP
jgi:hypothetical protein